MQIDDKKKLSKEITRDIVNNYKQILSPILILNIMNATLIKNWALAALAVAAVSCAKEQTSPNVDDGQEVNVAFNIAAPSALVTKAINDGQTAKNLTVAVYDDNNGSAGNHIVALDQTETFTDLKANVTFSLVKGKTYHFIFWAQAEKEGGPYTLDKDNKVVKISYADAAANDESRDAFFATKSLKVTGALNETVELHRPFAQVNFGTADFEKAVAAGFEPTMSKFTATEAADELDLFGREGKVSNGGSSDIAYTEAAIPNDDKGLKLSDGTTYKWLAMNYFIPVGKLDEQHVSDLKATFVTKDAKSVEISVPAAPVQANYRTNIVGNLLTDQVIFNVVIDPNFEGNETIAFWDGSNEEVTPTADGVYEISNGSQLAWVAQQVNAGTETFSGKTVKLVKNIYLANRPWTPIGNNSAVYFKGTFDGNGKTIYDLNSYSERNEKEGSEQTAGLFGACQNATIKNVTVNNATIKSYHYAGVICAWTKDTQIENCKVDNATVISSCKLVGSTWSSGSKVGGIAGYISEGSSAKTCTVENSTIKGYRDLGGVVGCASTNCEVIDNTINNVTIIIDASHNDEGYTEQSQYNAKFDVGRNISSTVSNNSGEATIIFPTVATTQEELNAAVATAGAYIQLAAGTYTLPSSIADNITIEGVDGTVFDCPEAVAYSGISFELKNLTLKYPNKDYNGFQHATSIKYENCVIYGRPTSYATTAVFENCTFNQTVYDYCIWTYASNITFNSCTFNCAGKAVKVYQEKRGNGSEVTLNNCTFIATNSDAAAAAASKDPEKKADKAAITIDSKYLSESVKFCIFANNCTTSGFPKDPEFHGTSLWDVEGNNAEVTVDGNKVFPTK